MYVYAYTCIYLRVYTCTRACVGPRVWKFVGDKRCCCYVVNHSVSVEGGKEEGSLRHPWFLSDSNEPRSRAATSLALLLLLLLLTICLLLFFSSVSLSLYLSLFVFLSVDLPTIFAYFLDVWAFSTTRYREDLGFRWGRTVAERDAVSLVDRIDRSQKELKGRLYPGVLSIKRAARPHRPTFESGVRRIEGKKSGI